MESFKEYNFKELLDKIMKEEDGDEEQCLTICIKKYNKHPQLYQQIINYFLDKGVNINCVGLYGWSPLIHAIHSNNLELVKFLVINGANIHDRILQCTRDIDILTYLLNLGVDPNELIDGHVPVLFDWLFSATTDNIDIKIDIPKLYKLIELFIKYGGNINIKDIESGETCLFGICSTNQYDDCGFLFGNNFNSNIKDNDNISLIDVNYYDICRFLLEHGADPNIQDNEGNTPLMECNSYEMCKLLLEYKASAKLTNNIGKTLIASFIDNENINDIELIPMCILAIWAGCDYNQYYTNKYIPFFAFIINNNFNYEEIEKPFNENLFKLFHSLPNIRYSKEHINNNSLDDKVKYILNLYKIIDNSDWLMQKNIEQYEYIKNTYYNYVFQFIPQHTQHIKLNPNNLGCQLIKINNDLRHKSEKEIYDELIKKQSKVIDYLNIRNVRDLGTNIKQYINTLYC